MNLKARKLKDKNGKAASVSRYENFSEREAQPLAEEAWLPRNAVVVVPLAGAAHHEETPAAEVERVALAPVAAPRLQDQPAGRAEREGGHYGILAELRLVIRVEPHAVAPVPIPVHEHVVEGHASALAHPPQEALHGRRKGAGLEGLARVAVAEIAGPGNEPGLEDTPAEEHDLALLPDELVAEGL